MPQFSSDEISLRRKIEAILFASSDPISAGEIAKILKIDKGEVVGLVRELIKEYRSRDTAIEIVELGDKYLMRVKPEFSDVVRPLTERDLEKGVLRTLAVIAVKQPIKLSDLAKIRGNKCYDHVKKLKDLGFIKAEKKGRATILTTTESFARYFGLKSSDPEEIKRVLLKRS